MNNSQKIKIGLLIYITILCLTVKVQGRCAASPQQQKEEICNSQDSPYKNDVKSTTISQINLKVPKDNDNEANTCSAGPNIRQDLQQIVITKNRTGKSLAIRNLNIQLKNV